MTRTEFNNTMAEVFNGINKWDPAHNGGLFLGNNGAYEEFNINKKDRSLSIKAFYRFDEDTNEVGDLIRIEAMILNREGCTADDHPMVTSISQEFPNDLKSVGDALEIFDTI